MVILPDIAAPYVSTVKLFLPHRPRDSVKFNCAKLLCLTLRKARSSRCRSGAVIRYLSCKLLGGVAFLRSTELDAYCERVLTLDFASMCLVRYATTTVDMKQRLTSSDNS
jgi:hypothetical protein